MNNKLNIPDSERWIGKIKEYVSSFLSSSPHQFSYHNEQHTRQVVEHVEFLAEYYQLSEMETFVVTAAAWFHDTGHAANVLIGHEIKSVEIMTGFFSGGRVKRRIIEDIKACILATQVPSNPDSLPAMILCDADTWHLGTKQFRQTDLKVKEEMEMRLGNAIPNWYEKSLDFMLTHQYYTTFCRVMLKYGKEHNIEWLRSNLSK